jgi:hypothetical protein
MDLTRMVKYFLGAVTDIAYNEMITLILWHGDIDNNPDFGLGR